MQWPPGPRGATANQPAQAKGMSWYGTFVLAGVVIFALLGGPGSAALAQFEAPGEFTELFPAFDMPDLELGNLQFDPGVPALARRWSSRRP